MSSQASSKFTLPCINAQCIRTMFLNWSNGFSIITSERLNNINWLTNNASFVFQGYKSSRWSRVTITPVKNRRTVPWQYDCSVDLDSRFRSFPVMHMCQLQNTSWPSPWKCWGWVKFLFFFYDCRKSYNYHVSPLWYSKVCSAVISSLSERKFFGICFSNLNIRPTRYHLVSE